MPPSDELFPGGDASEPWRPPTATAALELDYAAGGAHATVAGAGVLSVAIDGAELARSRSMSPGLVDLAEHPRHQRHSLSIGATPGVEVYSVSFSAGLP